MAVAAIIVVTLIVTASGRDGGRTRGVERADLATTAVMVWAGLLALVLVVTVAGGSSEGPQPETVGNDDD